MRRRDFIAAVAVPVAIISTNPLSVLANNVTISVPKGYPETTRELYEWVNSKVVSILSVPPFPESTTALGFGYPPTDEHEITEQQLDAIEQHGIPTYVYGIRQNPSCFDAHAEMALCAAAARQLEKDMEGKDKIFWRRKPELSKSRDFTTDEVTLKLCFRAVFL